jgi:catechol 2,3-dioxygenase-like lactoylglutathione lyase family enzyme
MNAFTITGTHHTSFTVSDIDRTLRFLREGLQLSHSNPETRDLAHIRRVTGVEGADVRVAYVKTPGHAIELIEYSAPAPRAALFGRPCDTGFSHICFVVDDIDAAVASAKRFDVVPGGTISGSDIGPAAGGRSVYLRDWDGITYELVQFASTHQPQ